MLAKPRGLATVVRGEFKHLVEACDLSRFALQRALVQYSGDRVRIGRQLEPPEPAPNAFRLHFE